MCYTTNIKTIIKVDTMEIKTYKTNDPRFPWAAKDSEGHVVNAKTKDAAINILRTLYQLVPKISEQQVVSISNEVKL